MPARRTLEEGIYENVANHRISVFAGPVKLKGRETIFAPLDCYCKKLGAVVTLERLVAWRLRRLADLKEQLPARPTKGTLAADVARLLTMIPPGSHHDDLAYLFRRHWLPVFGTRDRHTITPQEIRQQIARWQHAEAANSSINHRVRALRTLYRLLDDGAPRPTDKIEKLPDADPEPRGLPWPIIEFILAQIPDRGRAPRRRAGEGPLCPVCGVRRMVNYRSKRCGVCRAAAGAPKRLGGDTMAIVDSRVGRRPALSENKIRLRLMAWMGIPQIGIERLKREHVQPHPAQATRVFLVPRQKGKRKARNPRAGQWFPVLQPAADALRDYDAADLWGRRFARRAMSRMWSTAIRNARIKAAEIARETGDSTILDTLVQYVPEDCRPYDLRHSFLSEMYRVSNDGRTVSAVAQHAPGSTEWERYTVVVVPEKVEAAFAKAAEQWNGPQPPAPEPLRLVKGESR